MNKFICAVAAAMVMCLAVTVYSEETSENLKDGIVRLHIIANSDSEEDQNIKLCVRDAILKDVRENGLPKNVGDITETADRVLNENGFSYAAKAETGMFYFPEKVYKDTVFPNGEYNAVRIVLGNGKGKNWWCVMYPPLCFDENADGEMSNVGKERLKELLDDETYELVTDKPAIRFKIVEIVNELKKLR